MQRPTYALGPRSLSAVKLLRVSVTDRCNLRCVYCMPDEGMEWMGTAEDLLTPEDFAAVAEAMMHHGDGEGGVTSVKLTGGEPTVRRDLLEIVERIAALGPVELSLTTNGTQLRRLAGPLRRAGLHRVTVSLDSLRPERFKQITRGGRLDIVLDGLRALDDAGFTSTKINVVVIRGWNDDELADLAALSIEMPYTVRFIEYMPLGVSAFTAPPLSDAAERWSGPDAMTVDNAEVHRRIAEALSPTGRLDPVARSTESGVGPATVWRIPGARGRVGFISAMSKPFCEACNRLRLTSVGELRSCLFDGGEVDLLPALRPRVNRDLLIELMRRCVGMKPLVHSARGNRAMSQLGG